MKDLPETSPSRRHATEVAQVGFDKANSFVNCPAEFRYNYSIDGHPRRDELQNELEIHPDDDAWGPTKHDIYGLAKIFCRLVHGDARPLHADSEKWRISQSTRAQMSLVQRRAAKRAIYGLATKVADCSEIHQPDALFTARTDRAVQNETEPIERLTVLISATGTRNVFMIHHQH